MKTKLVAAFAMLSACASTGGGTITLIDGDKGLDNFTRDGDANWRAEGGMIVADKGKGGFLVSKQSSGGYHMRVEFFPGPVALQFANLPNNVQGGAIRFRKLEVRPL